MTIAPGSRIALLGRNGAGKSTLMKLLAGELRRIAGKRTEARDLRIGYFAQHQLEQLTVDESPLAHLKRLGGAAARGRRSRSCAASSGGFGFSGDRVFEPVGPFSGGEKARLVLALVSYLRPNLLLLDEPTNHLDLEMRQALAVALQDYEAAVVLVSHDRHLLRAVADELFLVDQGRATPFRRRSRRLRPLVHGARTEGNGGATGASRRRRAEDRKQRKREEAERRNRLSPLGTKLRWRNGGDDRATRTGARRHEQELASPEIYGAAAKARLRIAAGVADAREARDRDRRSRLAGGERASRGALAAAAAS